MVQTIALALLILIANSMYVGFVLGNNKNEHGLFQSAYSQTKQSGQKPTRSFASEAIAPVLLVPIAISGNNVYVVWSSNKTGNYEIMFRASSDHGQTFGNKINLSNSTSDSHSAEVEYLLRGGNVILQITNLYLGLALMMERLLVQF